MALKAGLHVEEQQAEARMSIQTVTGHIVVRAVRRTFDLPMGGLLAYRSIIHDVAALEESAVLLSIAWSEEH